MPRLHHLCLAGFITTERNRYYLTPLGIEYLQAIETALTKYKTPRKWVELRNKRAHK